MLLTEINVEAGTACQTIAYSSTGGRTVRADVLILHVPKSIVRSLEAYESPGVVGWCRSKPCFTIENRIGHEELCSIEGAGNGTSSARKSRG